MTEPSYAIIDFMIEIGYGRPMRGYIVLRRPILDGASPDIALERDVPSVIRIGELRHEAEDFHTYEWVEVARR